MSKNMIKNLSLKSNYDTFLNTVQDYKDKLEDIIHEEYSTAMELGMDIESRYVQESIYNHFIKEIGSKEIQKFTQNFDSVLIQREPVLKRHVGEYIETIKSWSKNNSKLSTAHYLKILVKDKLSNEVCKRIVPVSDYYSEEQIVVMMINHPEDYLPIFNRIKKTGAKINMDDIEILGTSNVTGLYDPRTVKGREVQLDELTYVIYSRIKSSQRETEKFVLDLLNRRKGKDKQSAGEKDKPYDSIALTVIPPNIKEVYQFSDYLTKRANMTKGFIKNTLTAAQNKVASIKKLQNTYNQENYDYIISQCTETISALKQEAYKNNYPPGKLNITSEIKETLHQNLQGKLVIDGVKEEIFIMTPYLYTIYDNELGHNTYYVSARAEEHAKLLRGEDSKGRKIKSDVSILSQLFMEGVFKELFIISNYNLIPPSSQ